MRHFKEKVARFVLRWCLNLFTQTNQNPCVFVQGLHGWQTCFPHIGPRYTSHIMARYIITDVKFRLIIIENSFQSTPDD